MWPESARSREHDEGSIAKIVEDIPVCPVHQGDWHCCTHAIWLTARMWSITVRADNTSSGIIRSQPSPVQHSSSEGLNRARTPHGARLRPSSRMLAPGRGTWYTGREEARRTRASGARSEAEKVGSRRRGTVRRRARAPHHGAGTHPRAFGSGWYPGYESVTERTGRELRASHTQRGSQRAAVRPCTATVQQAVQ